MRALVLCFSLAALAAAGVASGPALDATTNGRDEIVFVSTNHGPATTARVRAGLIFKTPAGARVVTLREATIEQPDRVTTETRVPAAALALNTPAPTAERAELTTESDPRLTSLLKLLETQPDLPRSTSQCAVLALTEDLTFAQWLTFRAGAKPDEPLLEAIDALALLRVAEPQKAFRLAQDPDLKLRALRHPGSRGKAAQLYGLALPDDPTPAQVPPDLGQLLHTKPGDNCPICRMRSQMQAAPSNGL